MALTLTARISQCKAPVVALRHAVALKEIIPMFRLPHKNLTYMCFSTYMAKCSNTHFQPASLMCNYMEDDRHFRRFWQPHRGMAGHSKWQNIRHIKAAKDKEKNFMANKMVNKLKLAVKEGGSTDPALNFRLARVMDEAKRNNVPSATVMAAVKQMEKSKDSGAQLYVDARGPGNCMLVLETFTDKPGRTRRQCQHVMKLFGGTIMDTGMASHAYDFKGVVQSPLGEEEIPDMDAVTDVAIEVGAEDVVETFDDSDKKVLQFICDPKELHAVKKNLEEQNYTTSDVRFAYIPHTFVTLTDQEMEYTSKLFEKLEKLDDIVRIFDNINSNDDQ